jgi:hypothetical protein
MFRLTASRPAGQSGAGVRYQSGVHDRIFLLSDNCRFLYIGCPLLQEDESIIYSYNCFWALPKLSISGPSTAEFSTYFTVSFEAKSAIELLILVV